jgi:hypothetical protein
MTVDDDFHLLRHRLNQMDYKELFTQDSLYLVKRLFADLIQTTEAMRKFKAQAERSRQEKAGLEEQVCDLFFLV